MRSFDPNKYFSPWLLFFRGDLEEVGNSLPNAFGSFLDCYWKAFDFSNQRPSKISKDAVRKLQIDYDIYSAEKDPAHGLFSGFFGKEWSEKYMNEFLFPLSL